MYDTIQSLAVGNYEIPAEINLSTVPILGCYAPISTNLLQDKADDQDLTKQHRRPHQ